MLDICYYSEWMKLYLKFYKILNLLTIKPLHHLRRFFLSSVDQ